MKKQFASKSHLPAHKRVSAAALLCCMLCSAVAPAFAAPQPAAEADAAALNFVGADIEAVIKAVGHYTNITFLIDPRVKGTITLVSEKSISKSQAFALLTSALRLQGYAIVSGDGYAKVVPEAEAKLQATPTIVGRQVAPKGDQIATQVFHLAHESAANLVSVLRPLISTNNTINANPGNNSLVITDYADNLKRLAKIVAALDAPANTDMDVIPVRHGIASDVAAMINKMMEPGSGADSGRVTVLADPRTNALILRAPSVARANLAKSLIAKLDQPTTELGNVHVVYLKNADATKLAETLRAVTTGEAPSSTGGSANSAVGNNQATMQTGANNTIGQSGTGGSTGPTNPALSASGSGRGTGGATGGGGYIQADASTNTLIITAPEAIYRNLRAVIDQLDVRRAQVYIEALIVEVNADKAAEFGVQWVGASGDGNSTYRVGGLQSFANGGNNLVNIYNGTAPSNGLSVGIFKQLANGKLGLGALAHLLETNANGNVLSTPNMITLDNEVASIRVGQNVPILTGQFTTTSGTNSNPFQTIDRKDVGLTLKVKPQISEGGTIKLAIYNESSSVAPSADTTAGIILNTRVIENNVIADDGQIIVLGGLIEDKASDSVERVPGLASLPVLGNLFKYNKRSRTKTNLMVFLRPVVIRNMEQSISLATDRYDYMRSAGASLTPNEAILVKQLGNPMLPPLVNGSPASPDGTLARPVPPAAVPARAPGAAEPVPAQPGKQ
ncbi:type II secretion system secretin GspD [Pseudoduganella chitinolytica]|uniref:Type II secretion system secretin GspD n=1 Tax=Pseudoduganella chitinolytica TaxID=34070 RepID=A0ABY8BB55_9BURK|nr:type II secretion system secretin GspD [Pseudoduganella chitinolytica]WEF32373.1 type II secretion system secretin GspD [Pseudoduganella chitinolytica]